MPRAIVTDDGVVYRFVEYDLPEPGGDEVRIRVEFAAPKHGTEMHAMQGSAFDRKRWDPELRMFLPRDGGGGASLQGPRPIGNMVVGTIERVGPEARRYKPGDRVFGYGPIRETHQASESALWPVEGMTEPDCVCVDPAHVAFVAVRDGNVRIGDTVAVYGLGAIGLMAVQIARAGGARKVCAVDPIAIRRARAVDLGADAAFDPRSCDAALEIKTATGRAGVDVAIETSGRAALHDAIRCIRQCGIVVHVPWGPHDCTALHLDEEFHLNRPTIVGSQAWSGWGCADRSYPLWTHERAFEATIELFRAGLIAGNPVVDPIVPFDKAPEALADIVRAPERTVKVGVAFGAVG